MISTSRRFFFSPFTAAYRGVVAARNALYDRGIFKSERVDAPVISVGNITNGGSGKTPCVIHLVGLLSNAGAIAAVVSRGYGRTTRGLVVVNDGRGAIIDPHSAGDEPSLIAQRFPSTIVVDAERRIDAARKAIALGANCIVADDAFQHRALARSLDIVIGGEEFAQGSNPLLPAGNGREPITSLARAHIVLSTSLQDSSVEKCVRQYSNALLFHVDIMPSDCLDPRSGAMSAPSSLAGRKILLVTGIARPERVSRQLEKIGATVVEHLAFRDHHWFTIEEINTMAEKSKRHQAVMVTTEKDWIRLAAIHESSVVFGEIDVRLLRVALTFRSGESAFNERVLNVLKQNSV